MPNSLLKLAILSIQRIGLINTLRVLKYTWQKARLDEAYQAELPPLDPPLRPGKLLSTNFSGSSASLTFENFGLQIQFLAPDLVRVDWSPEDRELPAVIVQQAWPAVEVQFRSSPAGWQISSSECRLEIDQQGGIQFFSPHGRLLRTEQAPFLQRSANRLRKRWLQRAALSKESVVSGLGERAFPLNLRGRAYTLWNSDPPGGYGPGRDPLYMGFPVFQVIHPAGSYLLFYENPHPASIALDSGEPAPSPHPVFAGDDPHLPLEPQTAEIRFEGGPLRYYFIPGPPARALSRYSDLTGKPPLPPAWALGYHQSRWGYRTQQDVLAVAERFLTHDMPLSAIHLDIDYMHGYRVFTVDSKRFPDLPGLSQKLIKQGVHLVAILDPGVKTDEKYPLFRQGKQRGFFCRLPGGELLQGLVWPGWAAFPDFTSAPVRRWWGGHYQSLLSQGVRGFWHDMNEPATITAGQDFTLPLATLHNGDDQPNDHAAAHNLYGLYMNQAGFEGLRQQDPQRRPWLLSRSGWAGVQRWAWSWTADIETSWAALRSVIATQLGLGMSGIPYSGSDIGGFLGEPSPELYLRWFQAATFHPFFRTHSAVEVPEREPWRFPEPYRSILRQFLLLRQQFQPYLYTLAWHAHQTGHPFVRPLGWPDHPDPNLWAIDNSFLLGNDLLVAPVLEPGITKQPIYLPAGGWYSFWTRQYFPGQQELEVEVSLETIPLFVRAGSVIPLQQGDELTLLISIPTQNASRDSELYSDAGDGYGASRVDRFTLARRGEEISLSHQVGGEFPFQSTHIQLLGLPAGVDHISVDGSTRAAGQEISIPASFHSIEFTLPGLQPTPKI